MSGINRPAAAAADLIQIENDLNNDVRRTEGDGCKKDRKRFMHVVGWYARRVEEPKKYQIVS